MRHTRRSSPPLDRDRDDGSRFAQLRVGLAHRGEVLDQEIRDALRVRYGFAARDEAEIELIEIALNGDVERAAVIGN